MSFARVGRAGISLIETLVVIGTIGLLLAVLLPTLANARKAARLTKDLSNQRQLTTAIFAFSNDRGVIPTISNSEAAKLADPQRQRYDFDEAGDVLPWHESIARYLGSKSLEDVMRCPADTALDGLAGYRLPGDPPGRRVQLSYGLNADLAAVNLRVGEEVRTVLGPEFDFIGVYGSNDLYADERHHGQGAGGKLVRVNDASRTLLLADAATPRMAGADMPPLDRPDVLAYTTNFMAYNNADPNQWGWLSGTLQTPWLSTRVPLQRHDDSALNAAGNLPNSSLPMEGRGGRLSIAFVDGHADTVDRGEFDRVKVSPHRLPSPTQR